MKPAAQERGADAPFSALALRPPPAAGKRLIAMGLFALITRFLPRLARREQKPRFAYVPVPAQRLERRRVLDAAGAGLALESLPDSQPFVQTASLAADSEADQQELPAALHGGPHTTIRLRDAELFEDQSTLAVVNISDDFPMAHEVTIDWGDGSAPTVISAGPNQRDVLAVHSFLDDPMGLGDGSFTVTATVRNSQGETASAAATILVRNVAPKIDSLALASPVDENGTATLNGTYSDAGTLDTHTLDIDWNGDGTFDQSINVLGGSFSVSRQILDDTPTATTSDTVNVNVRLRDDDGGEATDAVPLTVRNVAPAFTSLTIASPVVEDSVATLTGTYVDVGTQDTHTLDIDWDGDGTFDETVAVSGGSFSVSRQFLDDNPSGTSDSFNVNLRLSDDDGGATQAAVALTIANANPAVVLDQNVISILEDGTAVIGGTYSDTGSQDTHELDIDWNGDGTFDQTVAVAGGAFTVTRQFLDDNPTGTRVDTSTVTVRLRDDDGGEATDSLALEVTNANPTVTVETPRAIVENGLATLNGAITDVGTLDTFTLVVRWGDATDPGDVQVFALGTSVLTKAADGIDWDPMTRQFSVDHQYLDDHPSGSPSDTYNIIVVAADDDTGTGVALTSVEVANADPALADVAISSPVTENGTAVLTGTYTDPGGRDTHILDIDWDGDGTFDQAVTITGGSFAVSHQFLDDDPTGTTSDTFNVNIRLRDDDGGTDTASVELTVENADPIVVLNPIAAIDENGTAVLTGIYSDAGTQDTHELDIDWNGDGTFDDMVVVSGGAFTASRKFLDDNPGTASDTFNVNVRLRDDDGGVATDAQALTVRNMNPVVTAVATRVIDENQSATLTGTITDVGTLDTFTLVVDWGDPAGPNNIETFELGATALTKAANGIDWDPTTRQFSIDHLYLDDNPSASLLDTYTIQLTVTDDDGGTGLGQTSVVVRNVDPKLAGIVITSPVLENGTATLTGTYSDPGTLDTHTLDIDWDGDGTFDEAVSVSGGNFSVSHQFLDDNPTATTSDSVNISVRLRDDDGGTALATTSIEVINVVPDLVLVPPSTIDEDQAATLNGTITDAGTLDTFTLVVDWGDFASPNNSETFKLGTTVLTKVADGIDWDPTTRQFSIDHQYLDDNPTGSEIDSYNITVTVTDDDTGADFEGTVVTVRNAAAVLTVANQTAKEGTTLDLDGGLLGTFVDQGTRDTHTATVNWGDGSGDRSVVVSENNGIGSLGASHIYADNGVYIVTVTVTDDDGGSVTETFEVEVANVVPLLFEVTIDHLEIREGEEVNLSGMFSDVGFDNPDNPNGPSQENLRFVIDWDDDRDPQISDVLIATPGGAGKPTEGAFDVHHVYADNDDDNFYTITVQIMDDDGGLSLAHKFTVKVLNVNPTLSLVGATDVTTGGFATFTLTFDDPGEEPLTVHIDWGDGILRPSTFQPSPTATTHTFEHFYERPPNPTNPAAPITIKAFVTDDDFGIIGMDEPGMSNEVSTQIKNPGIGAEPFRIDTTPRVPQLTFPVREVPLPVPNNTTAAFTSQQTFTIGGSAGEAPAVSYRYFELRVIDADGNEGPGYPLPANVLEDLPALFRTLPDNHYAIYVVNTETNVPRLVIEVFVRNGKMIDPGDDSEGTRDRPPTDEKKVEPAATVPIEGAAVTMPANEAINHGHQGEVPVTTFPVHGFSRWTAAALGLAASTSAQSWAHRVDEALAKATAEQWRKLQGHNPPKPKKL